MKQYKNIHCPFCCICAVGMQKHAGLTGCLFFCTECQNLLVELLVLMMKDRTTAEEMSLLLHIFLEKTPPIVRLLLHYFILNKHTVYIIQTFNYINVNINLNVIVKGEKQYVVRFTSI